MSRGERSRPERSAQERQRDRAERERRRAERGGEVFPPAPVEPPADAPVEPLLDIPAEPTVVEPAEEAPAEPVADPEPEFEFPDEAAVPEPKAPLSPESPSFVPEPEHEAAPGVPAPSEIEQPLEEGEVVSVFEPMAPEPEDEVSEEAHPAESEPADVVSELVVPKPPAALPGVTRTLSAPTPLPPLPAAPRGRGGRPQPSRRSAGRPLARIGALMALAAVVVVAAIVLIHSLTSSNKEKVVTTPPVVKVLVSEGKTRAQIAQVAKTAGLKGSYRAAAKSSALLNPGHYGAPKDTPDLEGFLFPATYELERGSQASELVREQLIAFQEHFRSEYFRRAKALHVSAYELLIVASMVEREAQIPGDRSKIAAVIYNRLADGIPLGIDASIYYAVEEELRVPTYTHELTVSQLHIDSPYNTRTHTGLPPTPIANPGVASIKAAAHPAHVAYLYYVAGADGCGEQVFSDTQAEFEANAAAYDAAVKRNGGHPPSCKHH